MVVDFPGLHRHFHFGLDIDDLDYLCVMFGSILLCSELQCVANYPRCLSFDDLYTCYSADDCAENG